MYRYIVKLNFTKNDIITFSSKDNRIANNDRYIQLLGFTKKDKTGVKTISFWDLDSVDLSILKNYKPVLLRRNGIPKILTTLVNQVRREEI